MNQECVRIADQLHRAFEGKAWHGSSLKELLNDVSAEQASARPIEESHSIWELVLHVEVWMQTAADAAQGVPMPSMLAPEIDWRPVREAGPEAWAQAAGKMFTTRERLSRAIEQFGDARLQETVPGRRYDFYYLFHGVVQHSLYHAGQIALLKKAPAAR